MTTLATSLASFDLAAPFAYEIAEERSMQDDFDFDAREDAPSEDDVTFYCQEILSGNLAEFETEWGSFAWMLAPAQMFAQEFDL